MPELPDILAYLEALGPRVLGQPIEHARVLSPFVLRTVDPPFTEIISYTAIFNQHFVPFMEGRLALSALV